MHCPHCQEKITVYKNPLPTVDIIIEIPGDTALETSGGIVLIERKNAPHGWALPGGFVDYGEPLEQAAIREAYEETGLTVTLARQLHTYSNPTRDPRQHTISTVFVATAEGIPSAGDDAARAKIFTKESLPPLVFDHKQILEDYYRCKKEG